MNTTKFWSRLSRPNTVKFCLGQLRSMQSNLGRGELNQILPNFCPGPARPNFDRDRLDRIWPNFV